MKFAFVVYEGLTLLDFVGFYDPVTRLKTMGFMKDLEYDVCAVKEIITSFEGTVIKVNKVKCDLKEYNSIFLPGGNGLLPLLRNEPFLDWLRNAPPDATMVSVCGGSLLLGAAGFLKGKKATTHPSLMQYLKKFTNDISDSRIVEDGNVITARGVTSSIDLGLYICERLAGSEARKKIQEQMDYLAYDAS